ncbi:MAG: hypothetical protein K6T67_12270, partial [Alicyclobacillus sp.]|nr:hypothetical protein [Alicyclobacillus sp.]
SLVGRQEGLASNVFGVTEQDAIFQTTFPGLTPSQVRVALEAIQDNAYYLRYEQGKFFANEEPTINSVLARIRKSLTPTESEGLLQDITKAAFRSDGVLFKVEHNIVHPEDLPDQAHQPVLGIVSLFAESVNVEDIITTAGEYKARQYQNHAYLLVPDTVKVVQRESSQPLFDEDKTSEARADLEGLARQVLAMQKLAANPMNFGVNPRFVDTPDFKKKRSERHQALQTAVTLAYRRFYYPTDNGVSCRELVRSAGAEKGAPLLQQLREILLEEGKLVAGTSPTREILTGLRDVFFQAGDVILIQTLYDNVRSLRSWPLVESKGFLENIIRAGVEQGFWCAFLEKDGPSDHQVELYHQDNFIPLSVNIWDGQYGLVTVAGAKKRGWWPTEQAADVSEEVLRLLENGAKTLAEVTEQLVAEHKFTPSDVSDAIVMLVRDGKLVAYAGSPVQQTRPSVMWHRAPLYTPSHGHVVITQRDAQGRGWFGREPGPVPEAPKRLELRGLDALKRVWPLLKRIESLYQRGAKSTVDQLDLLDLQAPGGAMASFDFSSLAPESLRSMGSTFEHITHAYQIGPDSDLYLLIKDVQTDCPFYQELKKLVE